MTSNARQAASNARQEARRSDKFINKNGKDKFRIAGETHIERHSRTINMGQWGEKLKKREKKNTAPRELRGKKRCH